MLRTGDLGIPANPTDRYAALFLIWNMLNVIVFTCSDRLPQNRYTTTTVSGRTPVK